MKSVIHLLIALTAAATVLAQIPAKHNIKSTKGNIEIYVANNGMIGFNKEKGKSGFIWPRGSTAQYIFGGGVILFHLNDEDPSQSYNIPEFTYDYMSSYGWFVPGAISDGALMQPDMASKYRVYSSINYDRKSGEELFGGTGPKWPIWFDNDYIGSKYGDYKIDESDRTSAISNPRIISDEDIVAIYKDTDTTVNTGALKHKGLMPYGLEMQSRVYCYDNDAQKNAIFINWILTNKSDKDISNFTFAPVFDIDITKSTNAFVGVDNDIILFPKDSSYVSFATAMDEYEKGESFGYISFKWIETPKVNDSKIDYSSESNPQLKVYGYRQIPSSIVMEGLKSDFFKDGLEVEEKGEQKVLMPTNMFTLPAHQSASFVMQINMTPPDEDYPVMNEKKRSEIETELTSNEIFFKDKLSSVESIAESKQISVYPNPVKDGNLNIHLNVPYGDKLKIELYDLLGNRISTLYEGEHINENYSLKLGVQAKGTYVLRCLIGGKFYSKKIVVGG